MSDSWRAWKERVFGTEYEIWHDGLYTGHVTGLAGAERDEALAMLRLGVAEGDSHAAQALADMGDDASHEAILAHIATAHGSELVTAVLAAHQMVPDPSLARHLVGVLQGRGFWSERIDAAIGLRAFDVEEDALIEAVRTDPEYLVRYHAAESLLARWKVDPGDIARHREVFEAIAGPVEGEPGAADYERYREGARRLLTLRPRT